MKHVLILSLCLFTSLYSFADPCNADSFKVKIAASSNTICPGQPVELIANVEGGLPGFTHKWSTGDTGIAITTTLTETTAITLEVYSKGCDKTITATDTILVVDVKSDFKVLEDSIKASVLFSVELNGVYDEMTFQLINTESGELEHENYYRSQLPTIKLAAPNAGDFKLLGIARKGMCFDTSQTNISVEFTDIMYIPTAVVADADLTANSIFRSFSPHTYTNYSLLIFAPNGQCLYECQTLNCEWTPIEVENCRSQKYLYVISYNDMEGNPKVRKGYFVLLN